MPVKIFVGNLVEDADQNKLRRMFERYGSVGECVVFNKYGFVHMGTEDEAQNAIDNLNQEMFQGQAMNVELSSSKPKRDGSNYGKQSGGRDRDGGGRGGRGGPMRGGRGGGRSGPYGRDDRDSHGGYGRDRDYPSPEYRRGGGFGDYSPPDDRDPRSYWPPPDVYFRWFYETYYPRGGESSARDPLHRPPPEYYRRERGSDRDFPSFGGADSDPSRARGGYGGGAKAIAAQLASRGDFSGMDSLKSYAYTTTGNSGAYTGVQYSSFE